MAFNIIRNDITKVHADAIVNTANPAPIIGKGTDTAVYNAAGKKELLTARKEIGNIERGCAVWTPAFNLKKNKVKFIIHTVGIPYGDGKNGQEDILRRCYSNSLQMAVTLGCKSVAIPLLATGCYGFPKELGLNIAVDEISKFLMKNEIFVYLVVYDEASYKLSEKHFNDVEDFLNSNFIPRQKHIRKNAAFKTSDFPMVFEKTKCSSLPSETFDLINCEVGENPPELDDLISEAKDAMNFQNTLQKLIADRKLENSEVYSKALIDRKFFSKIITHKNYIPKKQTVMALGLALKLSLEEYEDFLASAGFAFMRSDAFDVIIKYCVMKKIYNLIQVDVILNDHGLSCFAPN
ncbi:MAG: macro domain-containing protein [Treponema sp.]|nr:macro domain-containing protein [Treponema sp.]